MDNLNIFTYFKINKLFKFFFLKNYVFFYFFFIIHFSIIGILYGKESLQDENLEEIISGFDDNDNYLEKNTGEKTEDIDKDLIYIYGNIGLKLSYYYNEEEPSKNYENDYSGINKFQTFLYLI